MEERLQVARELAAQGMNKGAVSAAAKQLWGKGFRPQALMQAADAAKAPDVEAPRKTEAAVEQTVEKEITSEAVTKIREAMATGKGVEDALGPYARLYGYENTTQFLLGMFDFWSTWHEYVGQLVEQNAAYKWAVQELTRKFTPEALRALEDAAIRDVSHSLLVAASQTGNYPSPETLRSYIQVIKEEMKR